MPSKIVALSVKGSVRGVRFAVEVEKCQRFCTEFRSDPIKTKIERVHICFINFRKQYVTCMHIDQLGNN